ncbi:MAG: hypothetical protein KGJ74_04690 [Betaproteobacteria bacterium]|jgi:hypothetical protein|uniref:hypothetical protein n=1 Tax=Thiomonas sp. TaxID=2047785 RepID=UPI0023A38A97|nr:hypothetical protein [Thiomonas sp.]MDE2128946.1 hypothetical protein [Betaproteobacteria bacterium]
MKPTQIAARSALVLWLGLACASARAQLPAPASSSPRSGLPPAARLADTQPKPTFPEPVVRNRVVQDRAVRIREQQVRGATTAIHVQPLHGGPSYSIVPPDVSSSTDPAHMQGRMQWTLGTFR